MNRHPRVCLVNHEAYFIARLAYECKDRQWRTDDAWCDAFIRFFCTTNFFFTSQAKGRTFERGELKACCRAATFQENMERLLRLYAGGSGCDCIWGDKTPTYLGHLPILREAFPAAKFLHIIRDPRDRASSVRKAWGGDALIVSENWREGVGRAMRIGRALGADAYHEIKYESLLAAPEQELRAVCAFLELAFDPAMLFWNAPRSAWAIRPRRPDRPRGS